MQKRWIAAAALFGVAPMVVMMRLAATEELRSNIQFREVGRRAGLNGVTVYGRERKTSVIDVNGSGVCWFDYNNDGLLDLYVVNGGTLEDLQADRNGGRSTHHNYLYRNNGDGTFTDVTEKAGVGGFRWGAGCAAADYNNDGFTDLFVTNLGECFLFRNNGDGTFTDVAKTAGVAGGFNWHTGATFGDYDGDGYLDLYVSGYLELPQMFNPQKQCPWQGMQVFCGPGGLKGAPDRLYHNNGDGTYSDVTRQTGVEDRDLLYGFTATFEDFDNDGRPDLFVANDRGRNYLYHNLGNGKFEEVGETWGVAYPVEGKPQANMGVAIGDYDHNGSMDVFVTTFSQDHYTLYHNTGNRLFLDVSSETGLASATHPFFGWGTFFADLDNDGWLDLFTANGHVYPEAEKAKGMTEKYTQRPLMFRQSVPGVFTEVALRSGLAGLPLYSSRGAAYADFDNDGDIDIVYTSLDATPTLLENITASPNHWAAVKTVGTRSNRDGIGARLKLTAGDLVQYASVRSGESYLSGNDPRVHFGLGQKSKIDELEIRWPSGQVDRLRNVPADRILTAEEGKGIVRVLEPRISH
jgi:enediyne biosynthesis protein E4